MDERKDRHCVPWDESRYTTGSTQPPKSHGALIAALCILVISLVGAVSLLGIANIRLFQKLNRQEQRNYIVSFGQREASGETQPAPAVEDAPTTPTVSTQAGDWDITLETSPESVENVPQEGGLSLQEIYQRVSPSVVSVLCTTQGGTTSGSGVILSADGYIVTNAHVTAGALGIQVLLSSGESRDARIVGSDSISDLSVLSVDAGDLTPAQFGDSDKLRVGDMVAAIGDPLGVELRGTLTDGIVSAINRDVSVGGRTMNLIQTNAALNSGNSGGPLINCYGQVIGINTMKIADYADSAGVEGLGFAIPSTTVKEIVSQLLSQGYVSGRPYLGLHCEALSGFYQRFYKMPAGLYISSVEEDGPAAQAGIVRGDLILKADGEAVTDVDDFSRILYSHAPGDTITLTIYRGGYYAGVDITLLEAHE